MSASLGLSPNLSRIWLCLSPWLGCCVRLAGLVSGLVSQFVSHLALSFTLAGVLCPPRWACLPICLPSGFVFHLGWGAVSASLGFPQTVCTVGVLNAVLSVSALAGVLCPPRWACLPICLPSGFVFHLRCGAVSASLGLSPNLSPTWLCLSPWPRWACPPICLPSGFVFQLGWGAVSASLGLSPNLSPNLSPIWLCLSPWLGCCVRLAGLVSQFVSHLALSFTLASLGLSPNLSPIWLCLSAWLGCCVRLAGLVSQFVSQFVSHLALSFTLAGVLCPPRWACLPLCLPICFPSGFVFHLGWGAVSASLWLGCCVRLAGLVSGLVSQFVSYLALSFTLAGVLCPPRWACLPICLTVYGWGSQCFLKCVRLGWGAVSASLGLSPNLSPNLSRIWLCLSGCCVRLAGLVSQFVSHLALSFTLASLGLSSNLSPIWLCLSAWLGCCVRLAWLVSQFVSQFVSYLALSFTLAGVLCPPRSSCPPICLPSGFVFHLGWGAVSASLGLSPNLSPSVLSPFVSHLALSFTLAGVLRPPRWACLRSCLPICLPPGFVFYVGWGAVSASLGLSPNSPNSSRLGFSMLS